MARVFSWKVSTGKYAYLTEPYIRNKVVDNETLRQMANEVGLWGIDTYTEHYNAMRDAVVKVYGPILEEDCSKYFSTDDIGADSVALLSGKDGYGSGFGGGQQSPLTETDYKKLEEYIEGQFATYHDDLQSQIDGIRGSISNDVTESVRNALERINDARAKLDEMEGRLGQIGQDALDALEAAKKLFELDGADITAEDIISIFSRMGQMEDWLSGNSESIRYLIADFDEAKTRLGEIGLAVDASSGLIDLICMGLSTVSGTVGTVRTEISAMSGMVNTYVEYVNATSGSISTIQNLLDASQGAIADIVEFYQSGGTSSRLGRYICGMTASMVDEIQFQDYSGDITEIYRELNAMSGRITTIINTQSGVDLSTFEERISVLEGKVTRALTISEGNLTSISDLRETWSKASGMLRTVSDLVIREDEYGPIYYFVGTNGDKKIRVWPQDNGEYNDAYELTGNTIYNNAGDPGDVDNGVHYKDHILPDFMTTMLSYIQQTSSSITINVTSGSILAALRLQVTDNGSVIYLTADRVVIEADVIAKALSANTADIGGVFIGSGMIYSNKDGRGYWLRNDGVLEATGAIIRGSISANSGYFTGDITANSLTLMSSAQSDLNDYIDTKLDDFVASGGVTEAKVNQILREYLDEAAFLDESGLTAWMRTHYSGLTKDEIEEYVRNIMSAETSTIEKVPNSAGGYTVYAHIGDDTYQWDTYDAGDYLILDSVLSGTSGGQITKFIVSKQGLLQANNAVIYGEVYASKGYFKGSVSADSGYFRGDVYANNGYFQGTVSATSGYIGNLRFGSSSGPYISDYFNDIAAQAISGNLDSNVINSLIETYLEESGFTGYLTEDYFNRWVEEWNSNHSGLTEATVSAIARSVVNSEISFGEPQYNSAGGVTYIAHIGNRDYSWDTYDTGKWLLLGDWYGNSSSASSGFCLSKEGLLQAYNAVVYGKICASEGYFKGDIYANDGYFNGSINATSGTIGGLRITPDAISGGNIYITNNNVYGVVSGDIFANSLTLVPGGKLEGIPSGLSVDAVNQLIEDAAEAGGWGLVDMGDYYKIGTSVVSGTSAFTVSKNGLLMAQNAVISGTVFATDGVFNGKIYADSGYFKGSITATSGYIGGLKVTPDSISGANVYITNNHVYGSVSGDIVANSLTLVPGGRVEGLPSGLTEEDVDRMLASAAAASGWTAVDMGDYYKVGTSVVSGTSAFTVSKNGLLTAKNAIISGTVFASNGVFNGSVYAKEGRFSGLVSASSVYGSNVIGGDIKGSHIKISSLENAVQFSYNVTDTGEYYGILSKWIDRDLTVDFRGHNKTHSISFRCTIKSGRTSSDIIQKTIAGGFDDTGDLTIEDIELICGSDQSNVIYIDSVSLSTNTNFNNNIVYHHRNSNIYYDSFYINNALYGDDVPIYTLTEKKFEVNSNGDMIATNATISGTVYATNGVFSGNVMANGGIFNGFMRIRYATLNDLEEVNGQYLLGDNAYLFISGVMNPPELILPAPTADLVGFMYDILTTPQMTRMESEGCIIMTENGSSIASYAGPVTYDNYSVHLFGGRYQIVLLPTLQWAIILATGTMEFNDDNYFFKCRMCPIVNVSQNPDHDIRSLIIQSGSTTPNKIGYGDALFIKSGSTIYID